MVLPLVSRELSLIRKLTSLPPSPLRLHLPLRLSETRMQSPEVVRSCFLRCPLTLTSSLTRASTPSSPAHPLIRTPPTPTHLQPQPGLPVRGCHDLWRMLRSRHPSSHSDPPSFVRSSLVSLSLHHSRADHLRLGSLSFFDPAAQFDVSLETQQVKIFKGETELPPFETVTEKIGKTGKTVRWPFLRLNPFSPFYTSRISMVQADEYAPAFRHSRSSPARSSKAPQNACSPSYPDFLLLYDLLCLRRLQPHDRPDAHPSFSPSPEALRPGSRRGSCRLDVSLDFVSSRTFLLAFWRAGAGVTQQTGGLASGW